MASKPKADQHGPFRADQLRDGDRYELSNGHPIYCAPSGREHAGPNLIGAAALETDPDVDWAGVDAGFSPDEGTLRAPDIAIAPQGDERGWIRGAPPLAVEYAGTGQDEEDLQAKIAELLQNGATQVWVVRLLGPRRVEVYRPDEPMRLAHPGESLTAPGLLRNPVPVEALYDRDAGHRAVLRNLLQRQGYADLDAVRSEGAEQGVASAIIALLEDRGLAVDTPTRARIEACRDQDELRRWVLAAPKVENTGDLFR
jgi:Uma2 family endonuclease